MIQERTKNIDWDTVTTQMHHNGLAIIPKYLTENECDLLKENYNNPNAYRKIVVMERHRFGLGEYKYFNYPLPDIIQHIRAAIYPHLAPIANRWFTALNIDKQFPSTHQEFLHQCQANNQDKATVLILKYGKGGFNTLHQDLYGDLYFPIQAVLFLSEPEQEYTGGEFVMIQQIPRTQSKALVLNPKKGDMLLFTTSVRPKRGTKGYFRVHMKHGVSELHSGERYTLGIIFHDAIS